MDDQAVLGSIIARERESAKTRALSYRREWMLERYRRHSVPVVFSGAAIGIVLLATFLFGATGHILIAAAVFCLILPLLSFNIKHHRQSKRWLRAAFRR
jgi:hypothetical protein